MYILPVARCPSGAEARIVATHARKCSHMGLLRATTAASSLLSEHIFSTLALSVPGIRQDFQTC